MELETRHTTPNPWRRRTQNGPGTFYPPAKPIIRPTPRIISIRWLPLPPPPPPPPMDPYRRLLDDIPTYRQLVEDPPEHGHEQRDWAEIPADALAIIFQKLGEPYARIFAGPVCRSWWRLATHPAGPYLRCVEGRCIDMRRLPASLWFASDTDKLCKLAFDHTAGQIDKLYAVHVSDDLLPQIADSVSNLRFLSLINSRKISVTRLHDFLLRRCPLLEELRLYGCLYFIPKTGQLGQACPQLKSFWFDGTYTSDDEINEDPEYNRFKKSKRDHGYSGFFRSDSSDVDSDDLSDTDSDSDDLNSPGDQLAYEIASNMPHLRRLQLVRCRTLTRKGLHALLDKCLHLESLDLRCCFSLRVDQALHVKLSKVKSVRLSRASHFRQPNRYPHFR